MRGFRITPFWQAVLVVAGVFTFLEFAVPPLMPTSVLIQYMIVTVISILLYFSYDDSRWAEFKAPIRALLRDDKLKIWRQALLLLVPTLASYLTYNALAPSIEAPLELRQVHPAPPNRLKVYDKEFDLTSLENPIREQVLTLLKSDPEKARAAYDRAVSSGSHVYYQNCFYCHGDLLDGRGTLADGLNPPPANFRDVGTIAQLQEAYLFWRITTGGPGLPKEGTPWNSGMPVWHEMLGENDVWNVIMFLYDHVGQVPRMWNQDVSRAVTALSDDVQQQRKSTDGKALYQFHCAVCHGLKGEGDGIASAFLYPKPRDFTTGMFKYKTSPFRTFPPTDEDLFHTIKNGLPGTGMPSWGSLLSDVEIRKLIPVVKQFDLVGTWAPEEAPDEDFDDDGKFLGTLLSVSEKQPTGNPVPFTEESVAKGKGLFRRTCAQCHGDDGRGNPGVDKRLRDEWGNRIWPRDLTQPWSWRVTEIADSSEETIRNIFTRLSVGIPGTPMPAHADKLEETDRWHIANYVYTLRNTSVPPSRTRVILSRKLKGALPTHINDPVWASAPAIDIHMIPNVIKGSRLFKPLNDALTVRSVYNDHDIAVRLEVDDRTHSRPGDPEAERTQDRQLQLFADAFAIQLPKADSYRVEPTVEKPLFRHGDRRHPTTIWYWNAGSIEPEADPFTAVLDATGEDKRMTPRSGQTEVEASAEWVNGRWRVMFRRAREAIADNDLSIAEGNFIPISFASWDGSNGEKGSRHKLTSWYWLYLPPVAVKTRTIGIPLAIWGVTFLLGFALFRRQGKSKVD